MAEHCGRSAGVGVIKLPKTPQKGVRWDVRVWIMHVCFCDLGFWCRWML